MKQLMQIVTIVLLAAIVYLLLTLIQSVERSKEAFLMLEKKISSADFSNSDSKENKFSISNGEFANKEYFTHDAKVGGTLTTALLADPPGLNPLLALEASSSSIFSLCSIPLAERDWQHPEKFKMLLAETCDISADRKTYRIKIRKNVFWHPFTDPETGITHPEKEVTAHDIKFTLDTIRNPEVNCSALRSYYLDLENVTVVNDHELVISWRKKYYGSLSATLELFPMPKHFYCPDGKFDGRKFNDDNRRNRMIVGCGPYIFRNWESSRSISLERNNNYIGKFFGAAPAIQKRNFSVIKIANSQFQSLLAGKINMLSLTPEQWVSRTDIKEFTSGKFKKIRYPGMSYSYIGYNQKKPCFSDANTRRAITMLINRKEIMEKLMAGCGRIAKSPFVPDSIYSSPEIKPHPYDPQKAKELLRKAGWHDSDNDGILERNGEKFSFTMLQISGSSTQMRMLPMIKNYLAAAGIDMKLQTVEWSVLLERLKKREFEACNLGWTGTFDPDLFQIFHSSQAENSGDNFISFKNETLDRKIVELRQEFDMNKRIAICHEIEKIIHDEQPYTFMFYPDALLAVSGELGNVRVFPGGIHPVSFFIKPEVLK